MSIPRRVDLGGASDENYSQVSSGNNKDDELDNAVYFRELDVDFINISKVVDDSFLYSAIDVLVQNTWELPIIIQWPGARVKFRFTTENGEIFFGIAFVAAPEEGESHHYDDLDVKVLQEIDRVQSEESFIEGEFELATEGVVIFLWDNNFDWSSNKQLSYQIEVIEPSFQFIDEGRCAVAQPELPVVVEIIESSSFRKADAEDFIINQTRAIDAEELEIAAIQALLDEKYKALNEIEHESNLICNKLAIHRDRLPGLCIRSLSKSLLSEILSYLNLDGGINRVCKYWHIIAGEQRRDCVNIFDHLISYGPRTSTIRCDNSEDSTDEEYMDTNIDGLQKYMGPIERRGVVAHLRNNGLKQKQSAGYDPARADGHDSYEGTSQLTPTAAVTDFNSDIPSLSTRDRIAILEELISEFIPATTDDSPIEVPLLQEVAAEIKSNGSAKKDSSKKLSVSFNDQKAVSNRYTELAVTKSSLKSSPSVKGSNKSITSSPATPSKRTNNSLLVASSTGTGANLTRSVMVQDSSCADQLKLTSLKPKLKIAGDDLVIPSSPAADVAANASTLKPPKVAEEKAQTALQAAATTIATTTTTINNSNNNNNISKASSNNPSNNNKKSTSTQPNSNEANLIARMQAHDKQLRENLKVIQSEQQMKRLIDHVSEALDKLDKLENEKRRIKISVKSWDAGFQKEYNRPPSNKERKLLAAPLYENYQKISLQLRVKGDKLDDFLKSIGLNRQQFGLLKERQLMNWKGIKQQQQQQQQQKQPRVRPQGQQLLSEAGNATTKIQIAAASSKK